MRRKRRQKNKKRQRRMINWGLKFSITSAGKSIGTGLNR
jgi:hypothetical protein